MLYYIKNVIMYVFNNKEYLLSLKKKIVNNGRMYQKIL